MRVDRDDFGKEFAHKCRKHTNSMSSMKVDGQVFCMLCLGDAEYHRAEREHPENPGFWMRRMFQKHADEYADELLKLAEDVA